MSGISVDFPQRERVANRAARSLVTALPVVCRYTLATVFLMAALTKLVPVSQIVYGTDYPYRTGEEHVKGLAAVFSGDDLKAIDRENAVRLMPQLGTA